MSSSEQTGDAESKSRNEGCEKNINSAPKLGDSNRLSHAKMKDIKSKVTNKSSSTAGSAAAVAAQEKQKVKEKIVRVKKKFDVMNKKFKELKKCGPEANTQVSRTRSSSVKSARGGSDGRELQRSISASISTTSALSLETVGTSTNGDVFNGNPQTSTRKRRQRNRKNSIEIQYRMPPSQICREMNLNAETLLILDLLALPQQSRQDFLMEAAIAKKIFIENSETHTFELNPKLRKLESIFRYEQLYDYIKRNGKLPDEKNKREAKEPKTPKSKKEQKEPEKVKLLFEEYVNAIVQEGLTDEQKLEFEFSLTPRSQRTKNYFYNNQFTERLEDFAQKCVEAQLGVIVEGDVRINAKNNEQAFINNGESDAMFPSQIVRKCALQGDIVRAFIRTKSCSDSKDTTIDLNTSSDLAPDEELDELQEIVPDKSAKGFVIKIIEEVHNRQCVGSFLSYRLDSEHIMFVPRDMKVPNIKIYRENWPEFLNGNMEKIQDDLYLAKITGLSGDICMGKIIQVVGKCGELESENKAILLNNNLKINPYDEKINEMFYGPIKLSDEERAKREDLRSECIFTIDPLTARDLDDAMSCNLLPNGNYEIGVHISDVTYFVEEDSVLDKMIQQRTTSVYMVNEVFHMLPTSLCLKCSLLPGEEKLTFSVFWEFTPEGEILNTRFCRAIIKSCAQFAYQHAQKIIDYPECEFSEVDFPMIHNGFTVNDIVKRIKVLHSISTILRKKRFDNGAIRINRPKLYFDLDAESGAPTNYSLCQLDTANFLIEEFMLLANQSVAKFTYEKFPEISFLRNHDPPKSRLLTDIKNKLNTLGLDLDISSSKALYQSFGKLIAESENPEHMEISLSHMVSKCMTRALYFCSGVKSSEEAFKHYALSIPIYTHFTSPIRRYPDILVHRVLSAALGYTSPPNRSIFELNKLAGSCNKDKYNAKLAGDDSSMLYFLHYIKSKKTTVVPAVIIGIFKHAFEVILLETGHVLQVQFPKKKSNITVTANTKTKPPTAQLVNKVPDTVPKQLTIFSEISVEIYEEKNKIKGRLPIPPSTNSDSKKEHTKSKAVDNVEDSNETEQKIEENDEHHKLGDEVVSGNQKKLGDEDVSENKKSICDEVVSENQKKLCDQIISEDQEKLADNIVSEHKKNVCDEVISESQIKSVSESVEESPMNSVEQESSTGSNNSSESEQNLIKLTSQTDLKVTQNIIAPVLNTLEKDFSELQVQQGCPEVEVVAE